MKKKKFNLLLEIATLCLFITAIAFGVYSAKTASLNVSGTVGFTAHNCEVYVAGQITGGVDADLNAVTKFVSDASGATKDTFKNIGEKYNWGIGTMYFDDINTTGDELAKPITIELKMYNKSSFDVAFTFNENFLPKDHLNVVPANQTVEMDANETEADAHSLIITITLKDLDFTSAVLDNTNILGTFNKYTKVYKQANLNADWCAKFDSNDWVCVASGLFDSSNTSLSSYNLSKDNIKTISFTLKKPNGYTKVEGINLNTSEDTKDSNPIEVYVKDTDSNGTYDDLVLYSSAKIYAPEDSSYLFTDFQKVTKINMDNLFTDNVTTTTSISPYEGKMFLNCSSLLELDLSAWNVDNLEIAFHSERGSNDGMFEGCTSLKSIKLPAFKQKLDSFAGAFSLLSNLEYVEFHKDTDFKADATISINFFADSAFMNCSKLKTIKFSASGLNLYSSCLIGSSSLETVTIPSNNTLYNDGNGSNVVIETATNKLIKACKNSRIPTSVTTIGKGSMGGNSEVEYTYSGTKAQWNALNKETGWNSAYSSDGWHETDSTVKCTVHCSDGDVVEGA